MMRVKACEILKGREFVSIATCDFGGKPNAASKFILKIEAGHIFLVDYVIGRTLRNLKINPYASLSFVDTHTLTAYQINGPVEIIAGGQEYEKLLKELHQKEVDLSIQRIMEAVTKGQKHEAFEVANSEKSVIFRVKIEEVVEMGVGGALKREKA